MQMIYWAVRSTAVIDYGDVEYGFHRISMALFFMLFAYTGWLSIVYFVACYAYLSVGLVLMF